LTGFLAEESCDFAVVRALRAAGYDVLAVAERARGAHDEDVIRLATSERRILLTEDKDFGQLVFAAGKGNVRRHLHQIPGQLAVGTASASSRCSETRKLADADRVCRASAEAHADIEPPQEKPEQTGLKRSCCRPSMQMFARVRRL